MSFTIEYKNRIAKEDVPFIGKPALQLIYRAIEQRLTTAPDKYGKPLQHEFAGWRRLRVSHYRVLYTVDMQRRVVTIHAIGHRKGIYDQ
jgi:mRNA interferase RelE/StbE